MKKMLCTMTGAVLLATAAGAQTTSLPYNYGFDNNSSTWQTFRNGSTAAVSWSISSNNAFDAGCLYHGYPVGGTTATDDWYVSPGFTAASGAVIDSIRTRFSGFGTPAAGDTVAIYLLRGSANPGGTTQRTLLYDFRGNSYSNDNTWRKVTNISIPAASGTLYIAIRYRTVVNWLDVNFDNIRISTSATGVCFVYQPGTHFTVSPLPAGNELRIDSKETFSHIRIYDLSGRTVIDAPWQSRLDISRLSPGSYVLELTDAHQQKGSMLITKQ